MDIRVMTFGDNTFDVAIDKGKPFGFLTMGRSGSHILIGTMDAMMTAKGDVWVGFTVLATFYARASSFAYRILRSRS